MLPDAHVGGEDGRRWRAHLEKQRSRAQRMRETRWTRENEALFNDFLKYRTKHPYAGPTAIVRAIRPRASKREVRSLVKRIGRARLL
jgi:hypothetical protein